MPLIDKFRQFVSLVGWSSNKSFRRPKKRSQRIAFTRIEQLESRTLLSGSAPWATADSYDVQRDDFDTAAQFESSVLANDMDMEWDPLTALLVNDASHGSLDLGSDGHFTYSPDTGYVGSDSFTYKAFDGTGYSDETTVSLSVSNVFSEQTNLSDRPSALASNMGTFGVSQLTGGVEVISQVVSDQTLSYQSMTDPLPVITVETDYSDGSTNPIPDNIEVKLSVGGIEGDTIYYSGFMDPTFSARFAHQIDASSLDTGRYDYEMTVIANYSNGSTSTRVFTGETNIVNRNDSEFGDNWYLAELDRLYVGTDGVLHVTGSGVASWFVDNGDGTFNSPAGPFSSTTLVQNVDDSYTLTDKYGNTWEFDSDGLLTSRADRNGNTTTYDYIDADSDSIVDELETITDPFDREITFAYTNGLLTSVTDFAGRVTELDYDTYDRLIEVTAPDPDGAGPLTSPVTSYDYDSSSSRLNSITDPLNRTTDIEYDFAGRFDEATYADESTVSFDPYQTNALVDTSSGSGSASNPASIFIPDNPYLTNAGAILDPMSQETLLVTDRFGYVTAFIDPLDVRTDYERNADGQVTKMTEDGTRVTDYTYDANGNLTGITFADNTTIALVYDTTINQLTSYTGELERETTFTYDSVGNLLSITDPLDNVTEYDYDAAGRLIEITLPDPDDTGSLTSPIIGYEYDALGRLIEVTNPDSTTIAYARDTADRITSITDELGRQTSLTYDNLDRLLTITQPDPDDTGPLTAPVWTYTYDAVGNRLTQVDPGGNTTSYEYDNRNRLVELTQPDPDDTGPLAAAVWTWAYNAVGNMTTATDPLGNETAYGYDNAARLSSITLPDPDGTGGESSAIISYSRDTYGRVTSVNDELNQVTSFEYDARNRLIKQTNPDPDGGGGPLAKPVTEWTYDDAGQLTSITNPLGRVTSYEYNDAGWLTTTTLPDPDGAGSQTSPEYTLTYDNLRRVISSTDPLGNVTSYEYSVNSRLTKRTAPDPDSAGPLAAPTTQWAYDDAGQLTSVTDPLGRVTSYDYDDLGRLVETTLPDPDGAGSQTSPVFSWTYDCLGNVLTATDALGNVTSYDYDNLSRLIQKTKADPDDTGPLASPFTQYAYDSMGRITSVSDPLSRTTSYDYDNLGRLMTTTRPDPDGAGPLTAPEYETTYDKAGNVLTRTDPLGNVTTYEYDNLQRLVSLTQPDPDGAGSLTSPVTQYAYDSASQLVSVTDPSGETTEYAYDDLGRLITTTLPDPDGAGSQQASQYSTSYDAPGKVLTHTDPLGNVTEYAYDDLGRLTSSTDPNDAVTQFAWDAAGNLTSLSDPVGNVTAWVYDDLNRVTSETNELDDTRSWSYDAMGNTLTATDRNGRVTEFDYDNLYRMIEEQWLDGQTIVNTINFSYDAANQLTSIADDDSAYAYTYDNLGRVTEIDNDGMTGVPNVVMSLGYDAAGRRTSVAAEVDGTDDFLNQYAFDNLGRLIQVQQSEQTGGNSVSEKRVDFSYNDLGQFDEIIRYADLSGTLLVATTAYTYDDAHRLTDLTHSQDTTTLADYDWTYDDSGRITQFTSTDGTTDYTYDDSGQLTDADHSYQTDESYNYDDAGNRTNTGYSTGEGNRLLSDGTYDYEYDAEGNRTKKTEIATGDYVEYTWDHRNRLASVTFRTSAGVKTKEVAYVYDAFNRRIGKSVDDDGNGTFDRGEFYVYNSDDIVLVFDESGTLLERYLHGPRVDQPLASEDAGGDVRWFLTDHQGTVRDVAEYDDVTDTTSVVNHLQYDAFGNITNQSDFNEEPRHTFTGREWDADAELFYFRARWYDAAVGRLISEDPIGFGAGDTNLSRYVGNDPVNFNDPSGLNQEPAGAEMSYEVFMMAQVAAQVVPGGKPVQGGPDWLDTLATGAAAFGDGITFGGTDYLREMMGINGGVDHDSNLYAGLYTAGNIYTIGTVGVIGYTAAPAALAIGNAYYPCTTTVALSPWTWAGGGGLIAGYFTDWELDAMAMGALMGFTMAPQVPRLPGDPKPPKPLPDDPDDPFTGYYGQGRFQRPIRPEDYATGTGQSPHDFVPTLPPTPIPPKTYE